MMLYIKSFIKQRSSFIQYQSETGNVIREPHVHGAGRMRRNKIAAIAFFGGWTLTLATFVFLVPALPPLKPTLGELSSSNRKGPEVVHRRVRPSTLANDKATQVEVKESFQLSNNQGSTLEVQPRRHDDKRRLYDQEVSRAKAFSEHTLSTSALLIQLPDFAYVQPSCLRVRFSLLTWVTFVHIAERVHSVVLNILFIS